MDNKSPAFQFYVQDFLSGVKFFSAEETGAYILLLCEQWDSGFIENNPKILKKITGISPKKLEKVLKKFEIKGEKLINNRLEEERLKRLEFLERSSNAGKESARKRAEERARLVEIELQLKSNSSSSLSSSLSNNTLPKEGGFNFSFVEDSFKIPFRNWFKYKTEIKKPFKLQQAVEACYRELKEMSGNHPLEAIKIVQYSISNEYLSLCKPTGKTEPKTSNLQGTI